MSVNLYIVDVGEWGELRKKQKRRILGTRILFAPALTFPAYGFAIKWSRYCQLCPIQSKYFDLLTLLAIHSSFYLYTQNGDVAFFPQRWIHLKDIVRDKQKENSDHPVFSSACNPISLCVNATCSPIFIIRSHGGSCLNMDSIFSQWRLLCNIFQNGGLETGSLRMKIGEKNRNRRLMDSLCYEKCFSCWVIVIFLCMSWHSKKLYFELDLTIFFFGFEI